MNSWLNGTAHNHLSAYTVPLLANNFNPWESRLEEKIQIFSEIENNFSNGGRSLYRFGHNISDGNQNYNVCQFDASGYGFHWATGYKSGHVNEQVPHNGMMRMPMGNQRLVPNCFDGSSFVNPCSTWINNNSFGPCVTSEVWRFGAGVHRFFYTQRQIAAGVTIDAFSGYAVNVNYENSILIQGAPVSHTLNLTANEDSLALPAGSYAGFPLAIRPGWPGSANNLIIAQIGGPTPGTFVLEGSYLIEYKITNPANGDICFVGHVISVQFPSPVHRILRTSPDRYLYINPNAPGLPARERHSIEDTVQHFRVATNPALSVNTVFAPTDTNVANLPAAWQFLVAAYDDIDRYLEEADLMGADICLVLNIGTSSPPEAVGFIEYVRERIAEAHPDMNLAFVELGSELMGNWNKSFPLPAPNNASFLSPRELGELTRPFAEAIKTRFSDTVQVATTSTYNWLMDFYDNGGTTTVAEKTEDWIRALCDDFNNPTECFVDFINIHNYPHSALAERTFDEDKVSDLLAVNQLFRGDIFPQIAAGLAAIDLPFPMGFVMTESNTADRSCVASDPTIECTAPTDAQHLTMTEGLYHAESFIMAADLGFTAFTPFAFIKAVNLADGYGHTSNPTGPSSFFEDSPDFDLLFYPNNGDTGFGYTDIFVKPTFMVKKMIAEGLGRERLAIDPHPAGFPTYTAGLPAYNNNAPVQMPTFGFLATKDHISDPTNQEFVYLLATNREMPDMNSTSQLEIMYEGIPITADVEIISLQGDAINDKSPAFSTFQASAQQPVNYPSLSFAPAVWANQRAIKVPRFSVNIIRFPRPVVIPECTVISSPLQGAEFLPLNPTIQWQPRPTATGYVVTFYDELGAMIGQPQTVAGTSYTVAAPIVLEMCKTYQVSVVPFNEFGGPASCPPVTFTTTCCGACTNVTINTNTTWDPATRPPFVGTLTIGGLATLTVPPNVTISFCPTGQVIVGPQATFNLQGVLTSCDGEWLGVDINSTVNATKNWRGTFNGLGNGENRPRIENALNALRAYRGKITCTYMDFLNNQTAFHARPVPNDRWVGSFANFTNCNFDLNDGYNPKVESVRQMRLWDSEFLTTVSGGRFLNTQAEPAPACYGVAGKASEVSVSNNTLFDGFAYGFSTRENGSYDFQAANVSTTLILDASVDGAVFDHCTVGIFDRASTFNDYTGNTFHYGKVNDNYLNLMPNSPATQIGISAESNIIGMTLRDNTFYGPNHAANTTNDPMSANINERIGTNMAATGATNNIIYRNIFHDMTDANVATGNNGHLPGQGTLGLYYRCNKNFDNTESDFSAKLSTASNGATIQPSLRPVQGDLQSDGTYISAGNNFTDPTLIPLQFDYGRTDGSEIIYFWADGPNYLFEEPTEENGVDVKTADPSNPVNSCGGLGRSGDNGATGKSSGQERGGSAVTELRNAWFSAKASHDAANSPPVKRYWKEQMHLIALEGVVASTEEEHKADSTAAWMRRLGSYEGLLTLGQMYAANGKENAAHLLHSSMANTSAEQAEDNARIRSLWGIVKSTQNGNLPPGHRKTLEEIAQKDYSFASGYARNILESFDTSFAPLLPIAAALPKSSFRSAVAVRGAERGIAQALAVFPNPSKDRLWFGLAGARGYSEGAIHIYSVYGTMMANVTVPTGAESVEWSGHRLVPGTYFARYRDESGRESRVPFIVSH